MTPFREPPPHAGQPPPARSPWLVARMASRHGGGSQPVLVAVAPGGLILIQHEGGAVDVLELDDKAGRAYLAGMLAGSAGVRVSELVRCPRCGEALGG